MTDNPYTHAHRVYAIEAIDKAFTYHPPHGDQAERYQLIRDAGRAFAHVIAETAPFDDGFPRETLLAIDKISEAVMQANAAIARHEPAPVEEPPSVLDPMIAARLQDEVRRCRWNGGLGRLQTYAHLRAMTEWFGDIDDVALAFYIDKVWELAGSP